MTPQRMPAPKGKNSVIIVAAGKGLRMGCDLPKQFCEIGGKPILMHAVEAFYRFDSTMLIVLVLPETHIECWEEICLKHNFGIRVQTAAGGQTRFHSVKNGLEKIPEDAIVGVHDAARPFVPQSVIEETFRVAAQMQCGAVPVIEEKNSIRIASSCGNDSKALDRSRVKVVQTPQVFPAKLLKTAYLADFSNEFTDDASVAEKAGVRIHLTKGDERNLKITTPLDMAIGELILQKLF